MAARAPLPFLIFVACGLCDGLLGLHDGSLRELYGLVPTMALWLLFGSLVWGIWALSLKLCFDPEARQSLRERTRGFIPKLYRQRHTRDSRKLAATTLSVLVGFACFAASSIYVGSELITHRHGAFLIALTLVAAQLGLALLASAIALVVRRIVLGFGDLLAERFFITPTALSAPAVFGALLLGAGLATGLAISRYEETLVAVDAAALALALASVLGFFALWSLQTTTVRSGWFVGLLVLFVGMLILGLRSPLARSFVTSRTLVAKYLLTELRDASDFDKDGTPWFPGREDCAPFDASRHPFVLEKPRNGIDENCDGSDELALELAIPTRREKPSRQIDPKPNLVLITMDATRADHMGFMGYKKHPTTPNLDALAKKSTIFTSAFSQDSGTGPSTWSLMTGRTPFQVSFSSAARFPFSIGPEETMLAEHLSRAGYQTSSALCGSMFNSRHWNIRRGFSQYAEVCGTKTNEVADLTATAAIERLGRLSATRPFFFWVHLLDPHHPYTDHKHLSFGKTPLDYYDEEIHVTDAAIGRILAAISALPKGRATYVAVTADHGENFGEHGKQQHARTLYREVTHVPLFIAGPDVVAQRISAPVASSDLYPTLLELAGVAVPARCTMTSQLNVLFGGAPDPKRLVFQENSFSRPLRHVKALVSNQHHMLFDTSNQVFELYDWRNDPKERINLYGDGLPEELRLRQAMLVFLTTTKLPAELKR